MDLDKLILLIKGKYSIEDFREDILKELEYYLKSKYSAKTSFSFRLKENIEVDYQNKDIEMLLKFYLREEILEWELDFILNCIDISDRWNGEERASNVVFYLSEPVINFPITKKTIKASMSYLNYGSNEVSICQNYSKFDVLKEYKSILIDIEKNYNM